MTSSDRLADAVRNSFKQLPGSLNALAKEAGVSQALIWRIAEGSRGVTPTVAAKIATALGRWGDESRAAAVRCYAAAKAIRRAVHRPRGRHGKA